MILTAVSRAIRTNDELQVENVLEESYWNTGDKYISVPSGGSKSIQIQFLAFALGSYTCQVNFINCFTLLSFTLQHRTFSDLFFVFFVFFVFFIFFSYIYFYFTLFCFYYIFLFVHIFHFMKKFASCTKTN